MSTIALITKEPGTYDSKSLLAAITRASCRAVVIDYTRADAATILKASSPAAVIPRHTPSYVVEVASLVRRAEDLGAFSVAPSRAIGLVNDKLSTFHVLTSAGIDTPKTAPIGEGGIMSVSELYQEFGEKCIVKPASGSQGEGVELVSCSDTDLDMERYTGQGRKFIAQEYIEESHGEDLRVIVVGEKAVAAIVRASADGSLQSNLHRGGKPLAAELSREEASVAISAAKVAGLEFAGVDILRSRRGPLVLEINSSPGLLGIERCTGVDIAGAVVASIPTGQIDPSLKSA